MTFNDLQRPGLTRHRHPPGQKSELHNAHILLPWPWGLILGTVTIPGFERTFD